MTIGPMGWFHLVCFGALLPWLANRSAQGLPKIAPRPRLAHFRSNLMVQAVAVAISLRVAVVEGIDLVPRTWPSPAALGLGGAMLLGMWLAARPRWRDAVARRDPRAHYLMPRTPGQRALWALVAVAAGAGQEITYRGVMYLLWWRLTGDMVTAALATATCFAAGHAAQGWMTMAAIGIVSLGFQGLVLYSGSLVVAVLVHVGFDLMAGYSYGWLGEELGYPVEGVSPVGADTPGVTG